eukprot:CAMPEP_0171102118 /NCGR_PEP_ID=MMETSP0766_2-20121228/56893_1 /TAXON_ID=439317 /ORGANISM="Gambierdiscus australes, Strain CAWD 149" /LENGTH=112 /DNA_ID=CAMNT_0011562329 /DNA_START=250 /DNA_END=588 /DNA_ORIENTATION=-
MAIPLQRGEEESAVLERHASAGNCCPTAKTTRKPRCPVPGCKEKLTQLNSFSCKACGQTVCMTHRFEDVHDCKGALAGRAGDPPLSCRPPLACRRAEGSLRLIQQSLAGLVK